MKKISYEEWRDLMESCVGYKPTKEEEQEYRHIYNDVMREYEEYALKYDGTDDELDCEEFCEGDFLSID